MITAAIAFLGWAVVIYCIVTTFRGASMSIVGITWECPICLTPNEMLIKKPTYNTPSFARAACKECLSKMRVKFEKPAHSMGRVSYEFIQVDLSEKAQAILESQQTPQKAE